MRRDGHSIEVGGASRSAAVGAWACAALAAWVGAGCAPSVGATIRSNASLVRQDATPERLTDRGDAAAAVGDMTRAEQYYAAGLAAGGDSAVLTRRLIRVCVNDSRYRVGAEYAENHLRRHPADAEVRFALATIYGALAERALARANFEALLGGRPNDAEAEFSYAVLLREDGEEPLLADDHFRAYLRLQPHGSRSEEARAFLLKKVTHD